MPPAFRPIPSACSDWASTGLWALAEYQPAGDPAGTVADPRGQPNQVKSDTVMVWEAAVFR